MKNENWTLSYSPRNFGDQSIWEILAGSLYPMFTRGPLRALFDPTRKFELTVQQRCVPRLLSLVIASRASGGHRVYTARRWLLSRAKRTRAVSVCVGVCVCVCMWYVYRCLLAHCALHARAERWEEFGMTENTVASVICVV